MSGIAGFVAFDRMADPRMQLDAMMRPITYRGRDGADTAIIKDAALAQLWLRSTPQSLRAEAPFVSPGGAHVIGDVRLDERLSLAQTLGVDADVVDDLELVGRSFDQLGRGVFAALRGDFAIAIWDPGERRLFLGRDVFGVKPVFYARRGPNVYFASQPTAILAHTDVPAAPDNVRIAAELLETPAAPDRTFLAGI